MLLSRRLKRLVFPCFRRDHLYLKIIEEGLAVSKQKKQSQKSFVRNLYSGVERLEDRIVLTFFSWVTSTYDKYVDPVVQKTVDVGKAVVKTVEKATTAVYKEVEQHINEPIVKTVKQVHKVVERAVDVAIDHINREIDSGIQVTANLVKTGEAVASKIESVVDSATPLVPGGATLSTSLDVVAGLYEATKGAVTGVVDLAKDGYFATVGQVTNPEKAKETIDKWSAVVDQVMADPTVIVTSVINSYIGEGNPGRIIGRTIPDFVLAVTGVGEVNAAIKGAKALKSVEAVSNVVKVAQVGSHYTNKVVKITKATDTVVADIARTDRFLDRLLPENPGKWNLDLFSLKTKTGAKEMPEVIIRTRLDLSGTTHSRISPKNVEPELNVEAINPSTNKRINKVPIMDIDTGKVEIKKDILKEQLPGFNAMGYGGRLSSIPSVTANRRR